MNKSVNKSYTIIQDIVNDKTNICIIACSTCYMLCFDWSYQVWNGITSDVKCCVCTDYKSRYGKACSVCRCRLGENKHE